MAYVHDTNDLTPVMTSATTPSPIVISDNGNYGSGYYSYLAFDHTFGTSNSWVSDTAPSVVSPKRVQIDFGANNQQYVGSYAIIDKNDSWANSSPRDWTFEGSNDGSNWTILDTRSGEVSANWNQTLRYFQCQKSALYRYYRISITANCGSSSYVAIVELELFDTRVNLCQTMTSNTAPSPFQAFASTENASYPAWKAFDKNYTNLYIGTSANSGTLAYYFGGDKFIFSGVSIQGYTLAGCPKDFTIECSNDNVTWDIVATYTGQTSWIDLVGNIWRNFSCKCNKSYRFIRLNITAVNTAGSYPAIQELKVFGQLKDKCITPPMTSNSLPSPYVASASAEYGGSYEAFRAFQRTSGIGETAYSWFTPSGGSGWLKVYLGGQLCKVTHVFLQGRDYSPEAGTTCPRDFTIQGSIDDVTYTTIGTFSGITDWTTFTGKTFPVTAGYYKYIKLNVTANNGGPYLGLRHFLIYGTDQLSNLCATMTSNSAPSPYTCSASSENSSSYAAWKAFNKDYSYTSSWYCADGVHAGTIQYYFGGISYILNSIVIADNNFNVLRNPKDLTIEVSNDGTNWIIVKTVTDQINWQTSERRLFTFKTYTGYKYLRLNISADQAGAALLGIGELEIYGRPAKQIVNGYPDITPAMTAASVPENWAVTATDYDSGNDPYKAYNHTAVNQTTGWVGANATAPKYNQIKLASSIAFNRIDITNSSDYPEDNPQDFEVYGSIDGSLYTLLAFFQGIIWGTSQEVKTFRFKNNIPYNYCKINCLAIKSSRSGYYLKLNEVYISREERDNHT